MHNDLTTSLIDYDSIERMSRIPNGYFFGYSRVGYLGNGSSGLYLSI